MQYTSMSFKFSKTFFLMCSISQIASSTHCISKLSLWIIQNCVKKDKWWWCLEHVSKVCQPL
jgi:hypothetical protein